MSIQEALRLMRPLDQPVEERPTARRRADNGDVTIATCECDCVIAAAEEMGPNEEPGATVPRMPWRSFSAKQTT